LADERPYHIIAPALHYTRHDVARIFEKKLGRNETEPSDQAMIARGVLRQKFLDADIGITGANFVVADSGAVVVVENEGKRAADPFGAEDPYRDRRHREDHPSSSGFGGVPGPAGTQRDWAGDVSLYRPS